MEFAILNPIAMEDHGFKLAINKPLGTTDTLEEARRMCLKNGGGAIFKLRQPLGLPDVAGGHQPYGEPISVPELKWVCLIEVMLPGTAGAEINGPSMETEEEK